MFGTAGAALAHDLPCDHVRRVGGGVEDGGVDDGIDDELERGDLLQVVPSCFSILSTRGTIPRASSTYTGIKVCFS